MALTLVWTDLQNGDMGGPAGGSTDENRTFSVRAERAGGIWFISVPDVPDALASTRQQDQIEGIARGLIARALDVPAASFQVLISSAED